MSNAKLETLLSHLLKEQQKLFDAKAILKGYKINSERLKELKKAAKDLREQVKEEKEHIEAEFQEDPDYVHAKESEMEHKERIKEISAHLREMFAGMTKDDVAKFDYLIEGEKQEVQMERIVRLYLNGKETK